ncbi:MAG TPA: GTPase domain-containing protein [Burkholderiaceae bacterium]|nr:GTPase domain-containing protein [Burkholderiaceae bacterium]
MSAGRAPGRPQAGPHPLGGSIAVSGDRGAHNISLSLVSHTNAGKTTLARTLLGRDVGTVRDAPHVTEFADVFTMLETPQRERLLLWDTPGFGDSLRLVRRLRGAANPVGWLVAEVWDRWRDRPFWASQQAMKNVRDEADVMLYLVNAAESPEAAGYVAPEMELLGWTAKPVIVLLNQLGAPRDGAAEDADLLRWRAYLAQWPQVRAVLPLDAFARCWVQEGTLLQAIEAALPPPRRALMARLRAAWSARRAQVFDASMASLAASLARLAGAFEEVPDPATLAARLRRVGHAIGIGGSDETPLALAQKALAERLDAEVRANTAELIALHGLEGQAQGEILTRLATHFETRLRMDEGKAALWGGMVSGALVGLKADILSGGLTLGGGLLAGGLIGALGAAGLARCVNLVRGTDRSFVAWNAQALDQLLEAALLRYLAVAHFGRGRGDWAQGEAPPHWRELIQHALSPQRDALALIWNERDAHGEAGEGDKSAERGAGERLIAAALVPVLCEAAAQTLRTLYPNAPPLRESAQPVAVPAQ